ncbi:hypothetical protein KY331_03420, partial [Candidatus Woesearchaeota archaeon]|nr:hypothetical protein [Candidatus Woesearchaeota archaeon]
GNREKPEDKPKQEAIPEAAPPAEVKAYATLDQAMEKLKVDLDDIAILPNGYKTTKSNAELLRNIAGVLAGTAEVTRIKDGYSVFGEYSYVRSPEVLDNLCVAADANGDGILTVPETITHARKVYAERTR